MPDFNRDGFNDIVLRNYKTGENGIWSMGGTNGTTVVFGLPLPNVPEPESRLELTADFNADNQADLLWRNYETGENQIWLMNDNNVISTALLPPVTDPAWQPRVAGDFTGDGKTDIVWRNTVTGDNVIWAMDGTTLTGGVPLPALFTEWRLSTGGDVDRNGSGDLLWRNSVTGDNVIWRMNRSTVLGGVALPQVPEAEWRIEGADDFDRNGFADFRWRNYRTGENLIWMMDGANIISGAILPPIAANSGWELPSGSLDNIVVGTSENDFRSGLAGADLISGRAGNDLIAGEWGNDTLHGEAGNDSLFGGAGNDYLLGETQSDLIVGDAGNDTLQGGNDAIGLPQEQDTLTGGEGEDMFALRKTATGRPIAVGLGAISTEYANEADIITDFQDGIDRLKLPDEVRYFYLNYNPFYSKLDLVFSPIGLNGESTYIHVVDSDGNFDNDVPIAILQNVAPAQLSAQDFIGSDLTLFGTLVNDYRTFFSSPEDSSLLLGDLGNDTIYGRLGNDLLVGSIGKDTLSGDEGNDTLVGGSYFQETFFLEGKNNNLSGGVGDDVLIAGDYTPQISSSSSSDNLEPDILIGGEGRDTFLLNKYTSFVSYEPVNGDRILQITDFQDGVDRLSVSNSFSGLEFQAVGVNGQDTLILTRQTGLTYVNWGIAVIENVSPHQITAEDFVDFPLT